MGINLNKGQTINLTQESGGNLRHVRMGLGWDAKSAPKKGGFLGRLAGSGGGDGDIDLDASAIMFSGNSVVDTIYFGHLSSNDGSVRHTGDNLTGAGDGDDESIMVDLSAVPAHVDRIVFTVNSFTGQTFNSVENAFVRVVDSEQGDRELARYTLSESGPHTAQIMALLHRSGNEWSFKAVGASGQGKTVNNLTSLAMSNF